MVLPSTSAARGSTQTPGLGCHLVWTAGIRTIERLTYSHWLEAVASNRATPRQIALGAALGSFVAFTPLIGIQMLVAGLAATLAGASKKAALMAVWISNPLTMGPIYLLTYQLGAWLTSLISGVPMFYGLAHAPLRAESVRPVGEVSLVWLLRAGGELMLPLLLGGVAIGFLAALVSYVIMHHSVRVYQSFPAHTAARTSG